MHDKRRIRHRFNRAAPDYEATAVLHREVEARVLERLDYVRLQPAVIVDIGAGPGTGSRLLMQRYPKAR
ncbi:MAG: malonyl-[acyl-carrier protein] O-methyltransferase BioC, partial [Gammaproteobacteria bacterium]|nr:malonyl-[acyl-carrier protein] O-methyltransferase BioC [Gammaproteobacteria bacterium]